MGHGTLLRLIELVRRDLGADDARVQIGGKEPSGERLLWTELADGSRLVVLFVEPVSDRERLQQRLDALVESFSSSAARPAQPVKMPPAFIARALGEQLAALASRAAAVDALVIDRASPVIWATSAGRPAPDEDVETAMRTAELAERLADVGTELSVVLARDEPEPPPSLSRESLETWHALRQRYPAADAITWRRYLLATRAIAAVRRLDEASQASPGGFRQTSHQEGFGYLARGFGHIYRLVVVFDGPFSELRAEGELVRATGPIERLVLSLPPIEPEPRGGRVIRFDRESGR